MLRRPPANGRENPKDVHGNVLLQPLSTATCRSSKSSRADEAIAALESVSERCFNLGPWWPSTPSNIRWVIPDSTGLAALKLWGVASFGGYLPTVLAARSMFPAGRPVFYASRACPMARVVSGKITARMKRGKC